MRYGIISDIHSNLEALQAVLAACRQESVEKLFCVGDVVGYGANPSECIDLMGELNIACVAGNHDWAVCGLIDYDDFRDEARIAVDWTKKVLSSKYMDFLKSLALTFATDEFVMVHGTLSEPGAFHYLYDIARAQETFELMDRTICFVGHTHKPQIFVKQKDIISLATLMKINLNSAFKYIVNVGSVGQPRDSNPMASFCIYDSDLKCVEIKRVAYDIQAAQKKIMDAGLPQMLALRLSVGR